MTKTFILRPNALLASTDSTLRFGKDNIVVIPMAVLEEINLMRGLSIEKSKIRREILEYIRTFNFNELTSGGVKQKNGSLLKVVNNVKVDRVSIGELENNESLSKYQKETLRVCEMLKTEGNFTILVTNNPCLQMRAESLNIRAECFKDETFPRLEEQYTGRISFFIDEELFQRMYIEGKINCSEIPNIRTTVIYQNQFVLLQCYRSEDGKEEKKLCKCYGKVVDDQIILLNMHERNPYGISPMNDGQTFLINALYDPSPLTVVKGSAGTGKTYCALAVALDELQKEKKYSRILVTRKANFQSIGYLPGELDNKMAPYLAGVKDNLSILLNCENKKSDNSKKSPKDERYFFERRLIQIEAIELLRGRSITNTLFIIDETQNIEPDLIKTIVTRAGQGSKFVFLGDPTQIDNPNLNERYNGLVYLSEKMKGEKDCIQITLNDEESVRSNLARVAAQIL